MKPPTITRLVQGSPKVAMPRDVVSAREERNEEAYEADTLRNKHRPQFESGFLAEDEDKTVTAADPLAAYDAFEAESEELEEVETWDEDDDSPTERLSADSMTEIRGDVRAHQQRSQERMQSERVAKPRPALMMESEREPSPEREPSWQSGPREREFPSDPPTRARSSDSVVARASEQVAAFQSESIRIPRAPATPREMAPNHSAPNHQGPSPVSYRAPSRGSDDFAQVSMRPPVAGAPRAQSQSIPSLPPEMPIQPSPVMMVQQQPPSSPPPYQQRTQMAMHQAFVPPSANIYVENGALPNTRPPPPMQQAQMYAPQMHAPQMHAPQMHAPVMRDTVSRMPVAPRMPTPMPMYPMYPAQPIPYRRLGPAGDTVPGSRGKAPKGLFFGLGLAVGMIVMFAMFGDPGRVLAGLRGEHGEHGSSAASATQITQAQAAPVAAPIAAPQAPVTETPVAQAPVAQAPEPAVAPSTPAQSVVPVSAPVAQVAPQVAPPVVEAKSNTIDVSHLPKASTKVSAPAPRYSPARHARSAPRPSAPAAESRPAPAPAAAMPSTGDLLNDAL